MFNEIGYEDPCPDCKWHCDVNGFPKHKPGCPRIPPPPLTEQIGALENRIEALERIVQTQQAEIATLRVRLVSAPSYVPPIYR